MLRIKCFLVVIGNVKRSRARVKTQVVITDHLVGIQCGFSFNSYTQTHSLTGNMSDPSSLEEINRTRVAAGLQPIPVAGEGDAAGDGAMQVEEDPDVVAQRNYQERVDQDKKDREAK